MEFSEAFRLMQQGEKLKLPSWGGYWAWDSEKETVMMHCRPQDADEGQGPIIDIRDTVRVKYTLDNINSGGMDYTMEKLPWALVGMVGMINTMANVV